ncbi:MAG: PEP-CTERM system histidine kinase PrsK, partial [Gammaproteobacteria bacterium]
MSTFATVAAWGGAVAFAILAILVLVAPTRSAIPRYLLAASVGSSVWFAGIAVYQSTDAALPFSLGWIQALEVVRDGLWLAFLLRLLAHAAGARYRQRLVATALVLAVGLVSLAALMAAPYETARLLDFDPLQLRKLSLTGLLALAVAGLVITEQLFRNTSRGARWGLKHLCIGVAFIFAFDFYLYADAVLFNRLDPSLWSARGIVNALAVPLIAVSASRNREWDMNLFVSRRVVFHGVTLGAAGAYLMAMAAAGYYIQTFGGEWGRALKIAFLSAALLILVSLFLSLQVRSRVRLFLARHFYRNKYEYGEEWLKFTRALSRADLAPESLNVTILTAVADIVDSPGGLIFGKLPSGGFAISARLAMYAQCTDEVLAGDPLLAELQERDDVWELDDVRSLDVDQHAALPAWLSELP